jgi:predicted CopG family antitoxin
MHKLLISIPDDVYARIQKVIPERQRSKVITRLIEAELAKQDNELYRAALAAEQDESLNKEMLEIEQEMFKDGLEDETW